MNRKKLISMLLSVAMVLNSFPLSVFAAETECTHHTEHTADCGYVAAVEGEDCTHVHDEACGYAEAVEEVPCACTELDDTGALIHTENCGYVAPVAGSDCTHTHDDACGYVVSVDRAACAYHCEICHVQELIDALPGEVTAENAEAVAAQLTAIDSEKESLSEEELAQVDFAKYTAAAEALDSVYAAVPAADTYTVTIGETTNGTVTADKSTAIEGETVTLNVSPAENYALDGITVTDADGNSVTVENNQFTMPASNVTVSATFKYAPKYNITVNTPVNGSVSADMQTATEGTTVTLTVAPNAEYQLATLTVNNGAVTVAKVDDTTYTFVMPDAEVTVNATFELIPPTVTEVTVTVDGVETDFAYITAATQTFTLNLYGTYLNHEGWSIGGSSYEFYWYDNWEINADGTYATLSINPAEFAEMDYGTAFNSFHYNAGSTYIEDSAWITYLSDPGTDLEIIYFNAGELSTYVRARFEYCTGAMLTEYTEMTPVEGEDGIFYIVVPQYADVVSFRYQDVDNTSEFEIPMAADGTDMYNPGADGADGTWTCYHTVEPAYTVNEFDSTQHDAYYSCCGATVTEDHIGNPVAVNEFYHKYEGCCGAVDHTGMEPDGICDVCEFAQYDVWVDAIRITSLNKDDVLNDSGSLKYAPDTYTLTVSGNVTVNDSFNDGINNYVIYSKGAIIITGDENSSLTVVSEITDYGVYVDNPDGKLEVTGGMTLNATGTDAGIRASVVEVKNASVIKASSITAAAKVVSADTTTYYATLSAALEAGGSVYALTDYSEDFTIPDTVTFYGGEYSFGGAVTNNGTIESGTFNGTVTNNNKINGGTFNGSVTNSADGKIYNNVSADAFTLGDNFSITNNGTIECTYHHWKNGKCRLCASECDHNGSQHESATDKGDGTHSFTCTVCGDTVTENHSGGEATCQKQAVCVLCGTSYGKLNADNHKSEEFTYTANADGTTHTKKYKCCDAVANASEAHDHTNGKCACGVKATPEVTAPTAVSGLVYTGEALTLINAGSTNGGTLQYSLDNATWSTELPKATAAGEHTVYYKVVGNDNYNDVAETSFTVTIGKATPTVTAPNAKTLTYNGEALTLVTAGDTNGGTMQYSTIEDGTYGSNIPMGTNAGTYTVWYKVVGGNNYNDVAAASITVTIEPKKLTELTFVGLNEVYAHTGSEVEPGFTVKDGDTTLTVNTDYTVEFTDNTNVGIATITITLKGNYSGTVTKTFEIKTHVHEWSYALNDAGDTITATCEGNIGTCPDAEQSITLIAPEDTGYTGERISGAEVTGGIEGVTHTLRYTGTDYDSSDAPTNAGTYTVTMTVGDKSVSDTFTISPKNIANCTASLTKDSFTYTGTAPELTVTAVDNGVGSYTMIAGTDYTVGTISGINVGDHKLTVTGTGNYTGTVELDYTITAKEVSITGAEIQAVTYDPDGYTLIVTNVIFDGVVDGETLNYTATAALTGTNAVGNQEATVTVLLNISNYTLATETYKTTVNISKAVATVSTAPTAIEPTYSGVAQNLINAGTTSDGEMQYSTDNQTWSTSIPQGINAGKYTVYYYVKGDANHSDSAVSSVTAIITQKALTPSIDGTVSKVYDGTTSVPEGLSIELIGKEGSDNVEASATFAYDSANVGTKKINATGIALSGTHSGNYKLSATTASADVGTITKAASAVTTAPNEVSGLRFKGSEQNLVTAGAASGGTVQYSLDGSNWSTTIPAATNAGGYAVYYKVVGDDNHSDAEGGTVSVSIAKAAAPTVSIPVQKHIRTVAAKGTVDLASYLPADRGNTTYGTPIISDSFFKEGIAVNNGVLSYGTNALATTAVGTVRVTVSMDNYEDVVITVNVELTDKNIAAIILPTAVNGTYNQQAQSGYTGSAKVEGYNGTFETTYSGRNGTVYAESTTAPVNAGDYTVQFKIPDSDLYYTGSASLNFSIAKAPLTIKAEEKSAYVGEAQPELTYTVSGLLGTDALETAPSLTTDAVMTKAGTYTITASGADAGNNYSITYVDASLTVSVKPVIEDNDYNNSDDEEESKEESIKVPVSGNKVSTKTEATVSGTTATVEAPSDKKLDKILDNPTDSGSVEIDLSGLDKDVEKVNLPLQLIEKVVEEAAKPNSKLESLEVKLPSGNVVLDAQTLQTISEEAECNTIRLVLDKVGDKRLNEKQKDALDGKTVYGGYEAYLYCVKGQKRISDFEGGEATLSVPFKVPAGKAAENFSVWYISDSGNLTRLPTWFDGKNICWSVGHFSDFVILYDANSTVKVNPETGIGAVPMDAILLLGSAALMLKKRR